MRLIDADEIRQELRNMLPYTTDGEWLRSALNFALHEINKAPTVKERPKGKWEIVPSSW